MSFKALKINRYRCVPDGGQGGIKSLSSPSSKPVLSAGIPDKFKCVNVPFGASGSSTTRLKLTAVLGMSVKVSGGLTVSPSQVYLTGIMSLFSNAELVICIRTIRNAGWFEPGGGNSFKIKRIKPKTPIKIKLNRKFFIIISFYNNLAV